MPRRYRAYRPSRLEIRTKGLSSAQVVRATRAWDAAGYTRFLAFPGESFYPFSGKQMSKFLKAFVRDERGVSAMEYAILAGIVVVALGAVGSTFSGSMTGLFSALFTKITNASNPSS
jgi:pilus assembly protein Flp/PilA